MVTHSSGNGELYVWRTASRVQKEASATVSGYDWDIRDDCPCATWLVFKSLEALQAGGRSAEGEIEEDILGT